LLRDLLENPGEVIATNVLHAQRERMGWSVCDFERAFTMLQEESNELIQKLRVARQEGLF